MSKNNNQTAQNTTKDSRQVEQIVKHCKDCEMAITYNEDKNIYCTLISKDVAIDGSLAKNCNYYEKFI